MDLPAKIPLFPLPNVVLFPGVPLPLHVFEPRYREMIRDTKDGHSIIGVTLLRGDWEGRCFENPEIFTVGCAGRIVSVDEIEDGKFNILLHGIREFTVEREDVSKPYRQADVRWCPAVPSDVALPETLRREVVERLRQSLSAHLDRSTRSVLDDPTLGDHLLVNFFCYALDLSPIEKQGLLETDSLLPRARRLNEVLEFHLHETRHGIARLPTRDRRAH